MVLTRSDSSSSAWFPPSSAQDDSLERDQRRVRHLHSITIRNLSLDPTLDSLFTQPSTFPPTLSDHTSDHSLVPTSVDKGKKTRTRASSSASWNSVLSGEREDREGRELVLDSGGRLPRTRPRRSSSAGTLLSRTQKIKEEGEEADGEGEDDSLPSTAAQSPQPPLLASTSTSTSNSFPFPFSSPSEELSTSTTTFRARSASRASLNSNGTNGSNSTIRQAPKLPSNPPARTTTPRVPSSSQFAAREEKRRMEALKRRLVDSFISIELVPTPKKEPGPGSEEVKMGRRRGNTIVGASAEAGPSNGRPGKIIKRSDSSSSVSSLRKGLARRRTVSSSFVSTLPSGISNQKTKEEEERLPPFFVSKPAKEEINPCFQIDQSDFLIPIPNEAEKDEGFMFPDDDTIYSWEGMRESRIRIRVFARQRPGDRDRDSKQKPDKGKGKGREVAEPKESEEDGEEGAGWKVLTEWDVDLSNLVSLGRNPAAFPSLPPNTLLFTLRPPSSPFSFSPPSNLPSLGSSTTTISPNDLEYFTAPLDVLLAQHRSNTSSSSSSSALLRRNLRLLRPSLSDDEGNLDECNCSSSEGEESDSDGGFGGAGSGNVSDPGVSASAAGTRARSGTLRSTLTRARGRRRANSLWRERVRVEEEKRRKIELLERSRRETRMVELAKEGVVERLWVGERELDGVRNERRQIEERLRKQVREGEVIELEREKEEREDRIGDLKGVKEAVEDEVGDLERKLKKRKEALRLRRDRLDRARWMDEKNREALTDLNGSLDGTQRTISSLQASISSRRTYVVTLLSHLFPIEPVLPSPSNPSPPPLLFSILSLPLPNSTYPPSYSDDLLSSALGHAAQLTLTLAAYLGVPLCYPIVWRGSRSVVKDEISMMKGPRAFPLYGKGVDQYRFDYGVFLLNKNIEQLMYSQNLTVLDLRNTLPNLKTLVLSLSYGEWSDEYAKASLRPEGVFATQEEEEEEGETDLDTARRDRGEEREGYRINQGDAQEGESSTSSGSTESTSEPSTTPEISIDSLPPRPHDDVLSSSVSTRSRSSSLASAASTVRPNRADSPTSSSLSSSSPAPATSTKSKRSSSKDSKSSTKPGPNRSNGTGREKPPPKAALRDTDSTTSKVSTMDQAVDGVKLKLEEGKRKRKESYGSKFASSVWSAVAGKAGDREHSHRVGPLNSSNAAVGNGEAGGTENEV
ncbi:uncharacterized protein JCM6883_006645 [Sporobolomyces salmoneus]|uniref:uncharacterized protein n=1 Tax=Sporobolomyces salmoneus TaxID=183962 RepID=UPI003172E176